jgi:polysaccharide pyruvyl transferase WcaK-like protein
VRILNKKASLCGVRDKVTQDFLHELGFESDLIGDPALFLYPESTSLAPWYLWPQRKPAPNAIRIGINVACHGWVGQEHHLERLIVVYQDVIGALAAKHPIELYYLAHTDIKAERQLAKRLKALWPNIIVCEKSPRKLKYVYEQMHLVISMMLHSSIYAFGARVPVVNVAYDTKNLAFMALIEHPERTIDVREANASALHNMAERALAEGFSNEDETKLQSLGQATQRFIARIAEKMG